MPSRARMYIGNLVTSWLLKKTRPALGVICPVAMRKLVTGSQVRALMAAMEDAAPDQLKADVVTMDDFTRDKSFPVLRRYGYNVRHLILDGTAADRAIFQSTDSGPARKTAPESLAACSNSMFRRCTSGRTPLAGI